MMCFAYQLKTFILSRRPFIAKRKQKNINREERLNYEQN